jgi:hypothetical protein
MGEQRRCRVYKNRWFAKFADREGIGNAALLDAVARAERGLVDADLGSGLIKQRIAREGKGKSGGYRTLLFFRRADRAVFAFGFAKSGKANLDPVELRTYRRAAEIMLALTDAQLETEVHAERLFEVRDDGEDVQD